MFTSVGWGDVIRWRDCVLTVILVEVDQHNTYISDIDVWMYTADTI